MNKLFTRFTAFLLMLALLMSILPTAFAAETETVASSESVTEPITEPTVEETAPSTEDTISNDAAMASYGITTASEDYGIMTVASSRLSNVTLLDLASPYNYTVMLPSQIAVQYKPNGSGSSKTAYLKNIAWHYYSYGGTGYRDDPLYCIEPYKNYAASTPGNYADQGVDVYGSNTSGSTGSNVWYSMPSSYRKAIAYILQCSEMRWDYSVSAASVSKNNNPNFPLRTATQILIYEIVMGLRNPDTFYLNSSNGYEDGDILYNAFVNQVSGFSECYHAIVSDVQSASLIPSFCSSSSSSAPTINLAEDSVLTWVHDDNGVMSNFTFTEDDRIYFNVYGNDLCIENYGDFSGTKTYSCYRAGPSANSATFNIFYPADSSYQTCVNLLSPATSYTYGYFKLYAEDPTGSLNITKTTSNSQNLSGWQFGIYYNSACTSLAAGPYSTNSSGKISISGLPAGTYYVKEIGNTSSSIASMYTCSSTNPRSVTITAGSTSSVSFTNTLKPGSLNIKKATSDGQNLTGWKFSIYSNSACTTLVSGPHTSNSSGAISVSNLTPGTYYVKEVGHTDSSIAAKYTCTSSNPQSVTITAGGTASVSFTNTLKPGSLNIKKTTSDGQNLAGWQFSIYSNSSCTTLISGPHTTNSNGTISVSSLPAGTIYVKEVGHTDSVIASKYTCTSTNPQAVTIIPGGTVSVSFNNSLKLGSIQIVKNTNTGSSLGGWQFGVYTNSACTSQIAGSPFTSGSDGKVTVSNLNPGTYYVKEISTGDSYWVCDTSVKTVVVSANKTSSATFTNTQYGRIAVQKSTNTGNHLSGWTFHVRNSNGDTVAEIVTDDNGYAVTGNLPLGRYIVQELSTDDDYWQMELGFHDITVKAGEIVTDEWLNVEQGLAWVYKKTNTGESVEGWKITIYSDRDCTQEVYTMTTNEEGRAGYYMDPGTYWAKETGDTEGRFDSEYWLVDERVLEFEVKPHEEAAIEFTNVQYGKLKVIKTMDTEGSVEGWEFKVTDANGKEVTGSPFTTAADGTILTGNLLPGRYTVEELIPKDSPYICVSENPQTVTVVQGEVAEVTFTNAMIPAKIIVTKVDMGNNPLAGAKFLLEWSEDGIMWWPVTFSEKRIPVQGGCSNPDVEDGCLISGEDGIMEWDNLHPGVQYRLTELEAPEGYVLLEDYAYEGTIPTRDYTLKLRVVNGHGFTLPDTGHEDLLYIQLLSILAMTGFVLVILVQRRKVVR